MGNEIVSLTKQLKHMEEYAVLLSEVAKSTDDEKIKQDVKQFLTEVSKGYRILVVGGEKTGRTTVLRNCFADGAENIIACEETIGVSEVRYGVQDAIISVENGYTRKFITNTALEGLVLTDVGSRELYRTELVRNLALSADVIVTVFSAENIQDDYVWDFIEKNALGKKVVCVMTKADLYPSDVVEKKRNKLLGYMLDLKLSTPVFAVSDTEDGQNGYGAVKKYIRSNVIGINPAEQKRQDNFQRLLKLQKEIKTSSEKRCRQFETDRKILLVMDERIKSFYDTQDAQINELKREVIQVIGEEIFNYQNSILKQFDPKELNRNPNTRDKKTFMEWLCHEVDRYERILNNRVEEKTRKVMRYYISQIDEVCTDVQKWIESREKVLEESDRFFGTIAQSKTTIVKNAVRVTEQTHEEYLTLMNVTEELFDKVWAARRKYDLQTTVTTAAGTATGAAIPIVAAVAKGAAILSPKTLILALVLGTVCYEAGKVLAEKFFDGSLVKNTQACVDEFKEKLAATRIEMENQVTARLDELFENEFRSLDKNFLQFRTATNIDAQNIPLLEEKLQKMDDILEQYRKEENIYEYC